MLLPDYLTAIASAGDLNTPHVLEVFKSLLNTNMTFVCCAGEKLIWPTAWGQKEADR